jgi:hypothetical protein
LGLKEKEGKEESRRDEERMGAVLIPYLGAMI